MELGHPLNILNSNNNSYPNSFLHLEATVLNNMLLPKGNITCPKAYMKKRESSDSNKAIQKVTTGQCDSSDKRADIASYKHQPQHLVLPQLILQQDSM